MPCAGPTFDVKKYDHVADVILEILKKNGITYRPDNHIFAKDNFQRDWDRAEKKFREGIREMMWVNDMDSY